MSSGPSNKPETSVDKASCTRLALDLLARREHSRRELERKLRARDFPLEIIDATLAELTTSGALAEARFTESFVRSRAARGQGPVRIRMELAERGIAVDESKPVLAREEQDWHALARAVRAKRFGPTLPQDYKERARQARFLQYRGFDAAQIKSALAGEDDSD
jgi:regulatory protein